MEKYTLLSKAQEFLRYTLLTYHSMVLALHHLLFYGIRREDESTGMRGGVSVVCAPPPGVMVILTTMVQTQHLGAS